MAKYARVDFDSSALLEVRESRGLVSRESAPSGEDGVPPDADLKLFKEMIENDIVLSTTIDATVDVITTCGYDFFSRKDGRVKKSKAKELYNIFKYDMDFDDALDNLSRCLISLGVGYMEHKPAKKRGVREINILEATEIRIDYNEHGVIKGFYQVNSKGSVSFKKDEVIYFRLKPFGSRVYPLFPLEPVAREYAANIYANNYLTSIFKNIPPHIMYILKNANSTQRKKFIQNLQIVKQNPNADLVAMGEADVKTNIPAFDNGLMTVLKWLRQQIFAITRVPPFWLGILEDSQNRGNAEAQIFAFETRIKKIQQIIENKINKELLPRMGAKDMVFKFNPFSFKDERSLLENAEKLRAIGVKKDKIAEFLTARGLTVEPDDFDEQEQQDQKDKLNRDIISMGRRRMDKSVDDMTSNIDQSGTSDLSPKKAKDMEQRSLYFIEVDGYDQYEEEVLKHGRV